MHGHTYTYVVYISHQGFIIFIIHGNTLVNEKLETPDSS